MPQRERCHGLARRARNELGSRAAHAGFGGVLPADDHPAPAGRRAADLKERLYDEYRIEIPVFEVGGEAFIRPSFQGYNDEADLERLKEALAALL